MMEEQPKRLIKVERTITVGNLLTILTLVVLLISTWVRFDTRLANQEAATVEIRQLVKGQNEAIQELRVVTVRLATLAEVYIPRIEAEKK